MYVVEYLGRVDSEQGHPVTPKALSLYVGVEVEETPVAPQPPGLSEIGVSAESLSTPWIDVTLEIWLHVSHRLSRGSQDVS